MNSLRVLVIEDQVETAALIAGWAELAGHQVRVAVAGFEALRALGAFQPNLVLLDIGLPNADGWELAGELRSAADYSDLKIIAVTAYQSAEDQQRSKVAGIDVHLGKPLRRAEILAALGQAAAQ